MKIIICDDDKYWVGEIKKAIYQWAVTREVPVYCEYFFSPQELIEYLLIYEDIDILFLEIIFGRETIDGMMVAKHIRKMGKRIPIIFVTVDSDRAAEGYLVDAMGFLSKPIDQNRLTFFLNRIVNQIKNERHIKIVTKDGIENVRQRDILYVEVFDHVITYHTMKREISLRGTLRDAFELLGKEEFVQICKSIIVSKNRIDKINTTSYYSVDIIIGVETINLPVSRRYMEKLKEIIR